VGYYTNDPTADFERGHFVGNTYTASWDTQIPLSSGKMWTLKGSISITLSSTDSGAGVPSRRAPMAEPLNCWAKPGHLGDRSFSLYNNYT
jgi:hypothetical protein